MRPVGVHVGLWLGSGSETLSAHLVQFLVVGGGDGHVAGVARLLGRPVLQRPGRAVAARDVLHVLDARLADRLVGVDGTGQAAGGREAGEAFAQHGGVFDGHGASLRGVRGHGVRGVAEQDGPGRPAGPGLQRLQLRDGPLGAAVDEADELLHQRAEVVEFRAELVHVARLVPARDGRVARPRDEHGHVEQRAPGDRVADHGPPGAHPRLRVAARHELRRLRVAHHGLTRDHGAVVVFLEGYGFCVSVSLHEGPGLGANA